MMKTTQTTDFLYAPGPWLICMPDNKTLQGVKSDDVQKPEEFILSHIFKLKTLTLPSVLSKMTNVLGQSVNLERLEVKMQAFPKSNGFAMITKEAIRTNVDVAEELAKAGNYEPYYSETDVSFTSLMVWKVCNFSLPPVKLQSVKKLESDLLQADHKYRQTLYMTTHKPTAGVVVKSKNDNDALYRAASHVKSLVVQYQKLMNANMAELYLKLLKEDIET